MKHLVKTTRYASYELETRIKIMEAVVNAYSPQDGISYVDTERSLLVKGPYREYWMTGDEITSVLMGIEAVCPEACNVRTRFDLNTAVIHIKALVRFFKAQVMAEEFAANIG